MHSGKLNTPSLLECSVVICPIDETSCSALTPTPILNDSPALTGLGQMDKLGVVNSSLSMRVSKSNLYNSAPLPLLSFAEAYSFPWCIIMEAKLPKNTPGNMSMYSSVRPLNPVLTKSSLPMMLLLPAKYTLLLSAHIMPVAPEVVPGARSINKPVPDLVPSLDHNSVPVAWSV